MRSFVTHALIFALIQLAIGVGIWRLCPDDPDHYMAATIDKHARLRAAESPRLIFVGGSSVGFGVDSRAFASLDLAPVNMGLSADLGLAFMLAEVDGELREGDVVIVAPETRLFWSRTQDDTVWAVLQRRPASVACLGAGGARAIADMSDQGLNFLARKVRCAAHQMTTDPELSTIYRRSSFDAFGDFVAHRELPRKPEAIVDGAWPSVDEVDLDPAIELLAAFAATCERRGARCFLAQAPIRTRDFAAGAELLEAIEARLAAEVDMVMLESPRELVFADEDFFDRGLHLTGDAAARRSARLAARLADALAQGDSP